MAKYGRHDNTNKKRNKHKQQYVTNNEKRLKAVGSHIKEDYEECDFSIYGNKSQRR